MIENASIIGGGVVVGGIALIAAAARFYRKGGTVEGDVDGDGETEVTFSSPPENDCQAEEATEDDGAEEDSPVPDAILEIEDIETITGIGPTRAETLVENGFETAEDLYNAADEDLLDVDGFGEHAVSQIRGDIGSVEEGNGESDSDEGNGESNESTETESTSTETDESNTSEDDTDGDGSTGDEETETEDDAEDPESEAEADSETESDSEVDGDSADSPSEAVAAE
ncbi:helix-hairpin-helix domain-containing protein [Natrinema sp. DC36]|uniref:helix-hairpin-helix domain-containing protein n=1 Tax=Natrinema sp. DC36 TaxID=2878680 RepID=UPI001CEFE66E|nr:helix-hairpin-helix domain-containing protein [Natrinema sp. DC36]